MAPRYDLVLFDADNTLFDFTASERQALRRSMEERGLAYSEAAFQTYRGVNAPLWQRFNRGEVTQEWLTVERFRRFGELLGAEADPEDWNRDYLDKLGDCGALLPGALELVQSLKPFCRVALATNGLQAVQRKRLRGNPLAPLLDGIFISQEMGAGKPQRAYFDRILEVMDTPRERAVMVGDDLTSDIQGAINAGIDSIWYSPDGGESPLPTYTVHELGEILPLALRGAI